MPPEWPFSALSVAWRDKWAKSEPARLVHDATGAFVDRTSIDWTQLLSRVRSTPDRGAIESLRGIDAIRNAARQARLREGIGAAGSGGAPEALALSLLIWLVIAVAATQLVGSGVFVMLAAFDGRTLAPLASKLGLAVAYALPVVVLSGKASRDPRQLFLLGAFVCAATAFARGATASLPEFAPVPAQILRGLWPEVFAPACLWQFALGFPRVSRFTRFDRLARRITLAAWLGGVAVTILNVAVACLGVDERGFADFLPNQSSNTFWRVFTLAEVLGLGAILVRARRAPFAERLRVVRLAQVLALCALPFLMLGLVRTLVPDVDRWLRTAPPAERFWLDLVVVGALGALPILTCVAVLVDRPFALHARVRRTWRLALDWKSGIEPHERIGAALEQIRLARGRREIVQILTHTARETLGTPHLRVLLPIEGGDYRDDRRSTWLRRDSAILAMMRESSRPLRVSADEAIFNLLPHCEREWLVANGVAIAAPILRRDGDIAAVVVSGSGAGDARRNGWWLSALLAAAATAWDADVADPTLRLDDRAFECPACGRVAETASLPCDCGQPALLALLPIHLGSKFLIEQRIGAGGTGVVYLARDARLERQVALKTLPKLDGRNIERLRREARVMAGLSHDGLATLYDLEVWRDTPILVMEYFPAGTLARRIRRGGAIAPAHAIDLGVHLTRALAWMHERRVLHRDLKPSNIALTTDGRPTLLDFGLVTLIDNASTLTGGTLAYLPPEAFEASIPGPAFDLWALAVVMVEAISGSNPFADADRARTIRRIVRADPILVCAGVRERHPALAAILERALDPDPARRLQTSREMQAHLESLTLAPNARRSPQDQ